MIIPFLLHGHRTSFGQRKISLWLIATIQTLQQDEYGNATKVKLLINTTVPLDIGAVFEEVKILPQLVASEENTTDNTHSSGILARVSAMKETCFYMCA
ncbi:MAG: hypothetical protein PHG02_05355 [Oscillospiraceae bacterium]|nr:hypothetical protein [Oscillospiraceae bacterium]